jgi:DNA (cytosine-5)-methyltransferase 1
MSKISANYNKIEMSDSKKQLTFIDLFAGCGGLSLGAMKAGFVGKFAVEYQKNAFATLKHNLIDKSHKDSVKFGITGFDWPNELQKTNHDIKDLLKNNKEYLKSLSGKIDLVVGGPPCQGFSNAGKRNESDPRNQLYKSYIAFINLVNPKILVIENVAGIASKFNLSGASYKDNILNKLSAKYHIDGELISSDIFGVPQKRRRYIIIGFLKSAFDKNEINLVDVFSKISIDSKHFTTQYSFNDKIYNISGTNVSQALSDLDGEGEISLPYIDENAKSKAFLTFPYKKAISGYQKLMRVGIKKSKLIDSHRIGEHNENTKLKYGKLIEISIRNDSRTSFNFTKDELNEAKWESKKQIINVLKPLLPSPTITTCPFDYIHYSVPRILTVREYARIQSFPDWFEFKGIYATSGSFSFTTPRYTQIGNAVPPLMAESLLKTLKSYLK